MTTSELLAMIKARRMEMDAKGVKGPMTMSDILGVGGKAAAPKADEVVKVVEPVVTDSVKAVEVPESVRTPTDAELDAAIAEAMEDEGREEVVVESVPEPVVNPVEMVDPEKTKLEVMIEEDDEFDSHVVDEEVDEEPVAVKPSDPMNDVVSETVCAPMATAAVPAAKLIDALAELGYVVGKSNSTLKVLTSVLIEFRNGLVILTATDLDQRLEVDVSGRGDGMGAVCVYHSTLSKFLKGRKGDVAMVLAKDEKGIWKLSVSCGVLSSSFDTLPAEDFPCDARLDQKVVSESSVDGSGLQKALKLVSPCCVEDATCKALSGVFMTELDKVVATDGRRLAVADFKHGVNKFMVEYTTVDGNDKSRDVKLEYDGVTVPVKSAAWLMKSKWLSRSKKVTLLARSSDSGMLTLEVVGDVLYRCRLVPELYPNYKQVVPVSFTRKLKLPDLKSMIEGVEMLRGVISERGWFVTFKLSRGKVRVGGGSVEKGEAGFDVPGAGWDGPDTVMSFNPDYMIAAFKMGCGVWRCNDANSPITGVGAGVKYVIMPMRGK